MKTFDQIVVERVKPRVFHIEDFHDNDLKILTDLYNQQWIFIERLPYTETFDALVSRFNELTDQLWGEHVVYNLLLVLRKNGRLDHK